MKKEYCPKKIEKLVQKYWEKNSTFQVIENDKKEKYYCLSMLPYPSGKLHMGHVRNYTIGDIIARYYRMLGKNVLHPIGWDAFGLPAENAAIKNNILPAIWTYKNISYMKKQLKKLGFSYDWNREITTCKPEYYKWEQLFFIKLYKKQIAYRKKSLVNWCPKDKTVLANEQVINGKCWRCDNIIQRKKIAQWYLKITNYAEELLNELDNLKNWPTEVIKMQKNWIGRSEGVEINFKFINNKNYLKVYTTRPDTLMGASYLMISPYHPLLNNLSKNNSDIANFLKLYENTKIAEEEISVIEKKGINTNLFVEHPITKKKLSIWIANFIVPDYATGVVMGVPAHDQRDWEFAKKYNLPILPVLLTKNNKKPDIKNSAMVYRGKLFNSAQFNGLSNKNAYNKIIEYLEIKKIGKKKIYYRLRDWCISRQRYWGVPIPMLKTKNGNIVPIQESELPIILPEKINIKKFFYPLKKFKYFKKYILNGQIAFSETDTFDTFMESSWYYARYTCPNYTKDILSKKKVNYWLPVDQYIGGIEHATLHLLYFRFFHKLLRDAGYIISDEPVKRLLCQGIVLSDTFYLKNNDGEKIWINFQDVKKTIHSNNTITYSIKKTGENLIYAGMHKMSKSKNNGVNAQDMIKKYGADTIRMFVMFSAPCNMPLEWKESGIKGITRFLNRLWNMVFIHVKNSVDKKTYIKKLTKKQTDLEKNLYNTIFKVSDDIERRQSFNTAIAEIMKITKKFFYELDNIKKNYIFMQNSLMKIVQILYPFAPHISHILWKFLNIKESIEFVKWPKFSSLLTDSSIDIKIIIQINGKFRTIITLPFNTSFENIKEKALTKKIIYKNLNNKKVNNIIYISNKLINFVTD